MGAAQIIAATFAWRSLSPAFAQARLSSHASLLLGGEMSPGRAWARAEAVRRLYASPEGSARPVAAREELAVQQVLAGPETPQAVLEAGS